jgi:hypothetical protein
MDNNISDCPCSNPNTACRDGKCVCHSDFVMLNNVCVLNKVALGKKCKVHDQCLNFDRNSRCSNDEICECSKNFKEINSTCIGELDNTCLNDSECINNAECENGKCVCKHNYVASPTKRVRNLNYMLVINSQ